MTRDERIATLLTRGVEQVLPSAEALGQILQQDRRLTIYCGFDPTAPTLHLGHALQLKKLRQFQDLGHRIIFLIGDFTARIGDPTDKAAVRKPLTEHEIKQNLKLYKKQASKFLRFHGSNAAKVRFNSKWLGKMKFADVLKLASLVTVEQMQKRDMFVRRTAEGKPTYLHEFLYPLMQGYDSVAMGVDVEIGGNDQLFNMLTGRTLLQQLQHKEKFVITLKLLEDGSGKKMSKSEGNMIALNDTPEDIYKKVMSFPDSFIPIGFELCTNLNSEELHEVKSSLNQENPRDIKMRLAFEMTKMITDERSAKRAEEAFISTFQKGQSSELVKKISQDSPIKAALVEHGLVSSNSELRRLVLASALSAVATDQKLSLEDLETPLPKGVYRIGKDRFFEII